MTKHEAMRRHARRRAMERYGINLGAATRRTVVDAIQSGRSTLVRRTSNRVTVHDVEVDGSIVRVAYDRQRHEPVTFLPREASA